MNQSENYQSGSYRIRPAGRHILTIGRDLIQDSYAAVVELVKNAFDADSPDVDIEFRAKPDQTGCIIVIADHGHGMSRDTVINKWMVPSTPDKLLRRKSPNGRTLQGRKGVGRYAASILGADLLLETVTPDGEKTTALVEWAPFENAIYLDDVEILIETARVTEPAGTRLTMTGDYQFLAEWNSNQFKKLRFELKKLISPVGSVINPSNTEDSFTINLIINGFSDNDDTAEVIEPFPIFDLFDYKISGAINADGKGELVYSQQKARNAAEEKFFFDAGGPTGCGELFFDIRVYDRDKDAIESLIVRGLKDEIGNYVGKNEARQLLNEYNGIGVYRNGFRIRPLGDADFDWLKLNEQRVQNPSLRIGSNQAIGYVLVQSEEQSGLVEKSARDGLRENTSFENLKAIARNVIQKLEDRRFLYRKNAGLSRPLLKVERELERLFSFDALKSDIRKTLTGQGVAKDTVNKVMEIISKDAEEKNQTAEEIRQTVAVYQGQATLGKIINIVLHEGRKPLQFFRNAIPDLKYWHDAFEKTQDPEKLQPLFPITKGLSLNADILVKLFKRLDPLAAGKRAGKKPEELKKSIQNASLVFSEQMQKNNITITINGDETFLFPCWLQDIYAIFTNLIDNSVYWIVEKNMPKREITITIESDDKTLRYIDYKDTGPGIEPVLVSNNVIFEPQFSTKPQGTGLGLAIAGEAATRNGLELKAFTSDSGAYFRLQPQTEN